MTCRGPWLHASDHVARYDHFVGCAGCWRQVPASKPEDERCVHNNRDLIGVCLLLLLMYLGKRRERNLP